MIRKLGAGLMALALVATATACSNNKNGDATASPSATSAAKEQSGKKSQSVIKMIAWQQTGNINALKEINKRFEEKYPEYKVDMVITQPDGPFKQMQTSRLNANDVDILPDLSSFIRSPKDWTPGADKPSWQSWIDAGLILDISDQPFVKKYNASDIEKATTYNGKVYGIPSGKVSTTGIYYNKDIFAKYNLKVPTTWTEFINVCETLKKNNVTPVGIAGKSKWPLKLMTMGMQVSVMDQEKFIEGLWKGTTTYSDPQNVEVLEKMKTVMDKYTIDGFMGMDYAALPSLFTSGKVAMISDGTWSAPDYKQAGMNFGYFPVPGSEDPARNANLAGKYDMTFLVASKGKNTEGALKWLEFYSEPENYAIFIKNTGFLPVQPDVKVDSEFLTKEIVPYMKDFKFAYEQLMIDKANMGEHIVNADIHTEFLAPGGPFQSVKELTEVQQKEWQAAK